MTEYNEFESRPKKDEKNRLLYPFGMSTLDKRATSLGRGTRSDFTRDLKEMIDPGAYYVDGQYSQMQNNCIKRKGFGFGTERAKMKNTLTNNLHTDNPVGPQR